MSRTSFEFNRQRIVVADDESVTVAFVIDTLRHDGHRVTRADDATPETFDLALRDCQLFICGSSVSGMRAMRLFYDLRQSVPGLPILCVAGATGWWTPELEALLPPDVTLVREPLTVEALRAAVRPLLSMLATGTTLAWRAEPGSGGYLAG